VSGASTSNQDDQDKDDDKDAKKKKNRCVTCRKKVGLTGELKMGKVGMAH
jgi:AN1-type zinc finger protein 5/6